jgi:pilus assembly protein CpaF
VSAAAGPVPVDESALADAVHATFLGSTGAIGRGEVVRRIRTLAPLASGAAVRTVADRVVARISGLGPLVPLLDDPDVSDILVNGAGPVWVERSGRLERTEIELTADDVARLLERVLAPLGLRVDRSSPLVDARLADGSRLHAVVPPLSVDGPCLAIRRFGVTDHAVTALASGPVVDLLRDAVRSGRNIVVLGGTGAGKTTLLNAMAAEVPGGERLVTVEDTAELRLPHPHVVRLEARPASADGVGAVPIRELVRNALRMRPDRIIVGEVRGPEALDMLQAMNTGHEGSLTTLHANSPADAVRRLETLVLSAGVALPLAAVRDQIAASVDLLVQVARRPDGGRWVVTVAEPAPSVDQEGRIGLWELVRSGEVVAGARRPARRQGGG